MADERIIDKLRKVLAMTGSPVEAEAATAMEMLQRLLTDHNLSMADLEVKGKAKPGVKEDSHDLAKAAFAWKLDLAEAMADHYFCWPIVNRWAKTVKFVGRPDNVESLKMLYAWVIGQICQISASERRIWLDNHPGERIDPLRWQLNFGLGCVNRLSVRLKELKASQSSTVTELVLSHKTEISDYMEERYGERIDGQKTKRELQWEAEYAERQAVKAKLKETDIDAYYAAYPSERPLTPQEQEAQAKADEEWWAKERKKAARRKGRTVKTRMIDWAKEEQSAQANSAGRRSANQINLEPFLKPGESAKGHLV